jgi:hypothetical protein
MEARGQARAGGWRAVARRLASHGGEETLCFLLLLLSPWVFFGPWWPPSPPSWLSGGVQASPESRCCLASVMSRSVSPAATAACSVVPTGINGVGRHSRCFSRRSCSATAVVRWPSSVTSSESRDRAPGPDRVSALDLGSFLHYCKAYL